MLYYYIFGCIVIFFLLPLLGITMYLMLTHSWQSTVLTLKFDFLKSIYFFQWEYNFVYILFALGLSSILVGVSYLLAEQKPNMEKNSGYECGFDPFSDARDPFYIRFYLVAILFILFDIEIVFFFPWIVSFELNAIFSFNVMCLFVFFLTLGFVYEWKKKALDWD